MPLSAGEKLGPYEIVSLLGKGGMGEVWKAHDPRLNRDVAIKISAQQFTDRFEREARAIAALNHPNICTLFDIGPNYLVMELVEGPTLAERMAQGPIPLDEALRIAKQIGDALEAAHEKAIVHRDLKPANVKIRPDGSVKVLDFGLAKSAETVELTSDSPTMMPGTQIGMILGTAGYMSPEQARGQIVDKRADIWAFGVVLYEMVTGKKLFDGPTVSDSLAAILTKEPDLALAPEKTRRLLTKCLQKDPKKRLRDIGDAWELLDIEQPAPPPETTPARKPILAWAIAVIAIVAASALAAVHFREPAQVGRVMRLSVPLPDNVVGGFLEISPDGRRLVMSYRNMSVRALDSEDFQSLPGTDGARTPFWSPDSRFIAFFADNKLQVVPAAGGPVRVLCGETGSGGGGGTWNRDGVILFGGSGGTLWRTDARSGRCIALAKEPPGSSSGFPVFLPDRQHFLYYHRQSGDGGGVFLATLQNPAGARLMPDSSTVVYTPPSTAGGPANLLFLRDDTLMAQPFDESRLEAMGDPFRVAAHASRSLTAPQVAASVSADGTLVYLKGRSLESQLTWFDRLGRELGKAGPPAEHGGIALAPDASAVAVTHSSLDGSELWLYDLARNASESRLESREKGVWYPVWSADSARILVGMVAGPEGPGLYQREVVGGREELLDKTDASNERQRAVSDWSRDGRFMIYTQIDPKTQGDIWYAPVESGKPVIAHAVKILGTPAMESQGQLSPDGRWLAYYSNESGEDAVYVRPFPSGPGAWKVSVDGGLEPRWSPDGREIFYRGPPAGGAPQPLMAASVAPDGHGGLRLSAPQKLFEWRGRTVFPSNNAWGYSVHPDGKRFLVSVLTATGPPTVNVILNWQKSLAATPAK